MKFLDFDFPQRLEYLSRTWLAGELSQQMQSLVFGGTGVEALVSVHYQASNPDLFFVNVEVSKGVLGIEPDKGYFSPNLPILTRDMFDHEERYGDKVKAAVAQLVHDIHEGRLTRISGYPTTNRDGTIPDFLKSVS